MITDQTVEKAAKAMHDLKPWDQHASWERQPYSYREGLLVNARAALTAALGDADWQNISTAPKDREILVCGGTRRDESLDYGSWDPFTDVALAQYDEFKDCWEGEQTEQYGFFILYKPTHWQDKPKPYAVTRQER